MGDAQRQVEGPADRPSEEVAVRLRQILSGDAEAVAWLYDSFAPPLYRRLRGRYGHLPEIEPSDLLQDAFLFYLRNDAKVLADFLRQRPVTELTTEALLRRLWDLACGLASNRRRAARTRPRSIELDDALGVESPALDRQLAERQLLDRLAACLRGRGERLSLYFTLRYSDGLAPREIADVTGWSRGETYRLKEALDRALAICAAELGVDLR